MPQRCKEKSSSTSSVLRITVWPGVVLCCWGSSTFLALFTEGKNLAADSISLLAFFKEEKEHDTNSTRGWPLDRYSLCGWKLWEIPPLEANIPCVGCCSTAGYWIMWVGRLFRMGFDFLAVRSFLWAFWCPPNAQEFLNFLEQYWQLKMRGLEPWVELVLLEPEPSNSGTWFARVSRSKDASSGWSSWLKLV